jgi:methyltransferase (TIGR00027 family)
MPSRNAAGRTAYGAASIRASETFLPEKLRLFDDPLVTQLLPAPSRFMLRQRFLRQTFLNLFENAAPGIRGALLCRTCAIDDALNAAISRGLKMVVLLGAGLDTRPFRLPSLAAATITVFELDLPDVQAFKKTRLLAHFGSIPRRVRFVPTDFQTEPLETTLSSAGLDPNEPAVFVWEGVTQYLEPAAVDAVLKTIAARPKQTELIFTYVLEEVITRQFRPDRGQAFRKSATRRPANWYFGIDPLNLESFLSERGLKLLEDAGAKEHLARYVQPLGRELAVSEIERVATATLK